ncbi:MAG: MEDS domain-containing protein, partial [Nitrososphaera sp.]
CSSEGNKKLTNIIEGTKDHIIKKLNQANYGEHNLIIYHNLSVFAEIYAAYAKEHLKARKELIVIFTCYETPDKVRRNLSAAGIDVPNCERENLLTIIDSMRVYSDPKESVNMFFRKAMDYARDAGKDGIIVFGDMGSFIVSDKVEEMLRYESQNPPNFEESSKIKGFCALHEEDFNKLMPAYQELLLAQHLKTLAVTL